MARRPTTKGTDPPGSGGTDGPVWTRLWGGMVAGRVARVTGTCSDSLPRWTVRVIVSPDLCAARSPTRGWVASTVVPSTAVMTSFSFRPAFSAGDPDWTAAAPVALASLEVIHAPWSTLSLLAAATPASTAR
jgi:hypothetical protein